MATAIAGAIAINGSPKAPLNFASNTTEPVANTIIIKVPISSAKKIFVFLSNLSLSSSCNFCNNFLYPFFYFISYLSNFFYRFFFWVF